MSYSLHTARWWRRRACVGMNHDPPIRSCQHREQTDHEGTNDIHDQRALREGPSEPTHHKARTPKPRDPANGGAQCNPEVANPITSFPFTPKLILNTVDCQTPGARRHPHVHDKNDKAAKK